MAGFGEKRKRDEKYEEAFLTNPANKKLLALIESSKLEPKELRTFYPRKSTWFTTRAEAQAIDTYKKQDWLGEDEDMDSYIASTPLLKESKRSYIDRPQLSHRDPTAILSVAIDKLGNIAAGCYSGAIYYIKTDRTIHILDAHMAGARSVGIQTVAFSEDGRYIFAGGYDKIIRIWDTNNQGLIKTIDNISIHGYIYTIAVHPERYNGRFISGTEYGAIQVWDGLTIATIDLHRTLMHSEPPNQGERPRNMSVRCIVFSPSGKAFASTGADGRIKIWDSESLALVRTIQAPEVEHSFQIGTNSISYAGESHIISGGINGVVYVWDTADGSLLRTIGVNNSMPVTSIAVSLQHRIFVVSHDGWGNGTYLYNIDTGKHIQSLDVGLSAKSVAIGRDGKIVTGGTGGFLIEWLNTRGEYAQAQVVALTEGAEKSDKLNYDSVMKARGPSLESSAAASMPPPPPPKSSAAASMLPPPPPKSSAATRPVAVDEKLKIILEKFPTLPPNVKDEIISNFGGKRTKRNRKKSRKNKQKRTKKRR
jgi:WD40 repeat protein